MLGWIVPTAFLGEGRCHGSSQSVFRGLGGLGFWRRSTRSELSLSRTVAAAHTREEKVTMSASAASAGKEKSVLVVGAGLAGVTAANALQARGFSAKILEASDRLGGRVYTVRDECGKPVEYGATWIHGREGNPLFQPALELGILPEKHLWDADGDKEDTFWASLQYVRSNGTEYPRETVRQTMEVFKGYLEELEQPRDDKADSSELKINVRSVGEYLDRRWREEFPVDADRDLLYQCRKRIECSISGCGDLNEVSAKLYDTYDELDKINTPVPGGMSSLVRPEAPILFNNEVVHLAWGCDGVKLRTREGKTYEAQHAIVTMSLGVLKRDGAGLFSPPLSESRLAAIAAQGFGVVDKIILKLDYELNHGCVVVCDDSCPPWMRNCMMFNSDLRTVSMWLTGDQALAMEQLPEHEIIESMLDAIVSSNVTDGVRPQAEQFFRTNWGRNSFFLGSYSFPSINCDEVPSENLWDPLVDSGGTKRVFFAGEATHPSLYSTMTGAHISGKTVAETLFSSSEVDPS